MNILGFVRLFGRAYLEREITALLRKHVSAPGYQALAEKFAAGGKAAADADPVGVAQAITDLLFSIR